MDRQLSLAPVNALAGALRRKAWRQAAAASVLSLLACGAASAAEPPLENVVNLQADASVEVPRDLLTLTFTATREGTDAATVQNALKQALDGALAEARAARKPDGQLDVHTGNFSLFPRYNPKGGGITGWQGTAEMVVEGRDMAGISALSGRIGTMTIARVGTGLSREQREKVEADVSAQAISKYQAKATAMAKQFGFAGYKLREVSVNTSGANPGPTPMYARAAAAPMADAPLPVEAGKSTVTTVVSGSVVLTR